MFFSVNETIKIAGKVYSPCICYEAKEVLIPTIEKLSKEGKAVIHSNKVFFQNGKILKKDCSTCNEECKCSDKKQKKAKKEEVVPLEEVPSPEEIAEGF